MSERTNGHPTCARCSGRGPHVRPRPLCMHIPSVRTEFVQKPTNPKLAAGVSTPLLLLVVPPTSPEPWDQSRFSSLAGGSQSSHRSPMSLTCFIHKMQMITKPASKVAVGLQGDQHGRQWLAENKNSRKPSCCQPSTLHVRP